MESSACSSAISGTADWRKIVDFAVHPAASQTATISLRASRLPADRQSGGERVQVRDSKYASSCRRT